MSEKIRVALLKGGKSRERDVSLVSGQGVLDALNKNGKFEVFVYDPKTDLQNFVRDAESKKFEVVFPMLHGKYGEDGSIQGLCELVDMPYVGSGIRASANGMDKITTKDIFRSVGIPVADDIYIVRRYEGHYFVKKNITSSPQDLEHRHMARKAEKGIFWQDLEESEDQLFEEVLETINSSSLNFPVVIKPASEGSSFGVSLAKNEEELKKGIKKALDIDYKIIVEKFLKGKEVTVGVIGTDKLQVFEPTEIIAEKGEFYDYESKYSEGGSTHIIPARISEAQTTMAKKYGIDAHKAVGCKHLSRTDMFITDQGIFVTEINTIPGFTPTSLLPEAAQHAGISYEKLCEQLVMWALEE